MYMYVCNIHIQESTIATRKSGITQTYTPSWRVASKEGYAGGGGYSVLYLPGGARRLIVYSLRILRRSESSFREILALALICHRRIDRLTFYLRFFRLNFQCAHRCAGSGSSFCDFSSIREIITKSHSRNHCSALG